ncbi:YihY/virulence factor BrkB family protein [Arthrobacter sp. JSM 101049]|uniref:YihY/virulence factor BrkB family protein n=1 Tax=Arthrobacter sp. JSM 101049 TaxID=929097 RepID=UPI00356390B5
MAKPDKRITSRTIAQRGRAAALSGTDLPGGSAEAAAVNSPLDRAALRVERLHKRTALGRTRREEQGVAKVALAALGAFLGWLNSLKLMRVFTLYGQRHGPLMAAGSAYNMFFSVAALLVAGFSIFGIIASGSKDLQDLVVETVAKSTPGLIDTGNGGLAKPETLFQSRGFGWTLVISTATMLLTSLGWIAGLREGMRGVYGLNQLRLNAVVVKLRDLGVLVLLGLCLVVTTVVGFLAGGFIHVVIDFLKIESVFAIGLTQVASLLVMLLLDALVAVILFRLASGINMPRWAMLQAALLAGAGSSILRYFSSELLGSVTRNPLLASFAVILGLFVWFYLLSQVYLIATAWGAVATADIEAAVRRGNRPTLRARANQLRELHGPVREESGWPQTRP